MNDKDGKSETKSPPPSFEKPRKPQKIAYIHCAKGGRTIRSCRCGGVCCAVGNDYVVDTGNGLVFGRAIKIIDQDAYQKQAAKPERRIKNRIIREFNDQDREKLQKNASLEEDAYSVCGEKIKQARLPMKLVKAYCLFDASKIIFYFTSDTRVDFRDLVKELAGEFHTRIEMKQIGVRDEAKMLGSYGDCGRPLCCATFLKDFEPVSIRMAKAQNISLDPSKISGACNRLMCCLAYEFPLYDSFRKKTPKVGEKVFIKQQEGRVKSLDVLEELIEVELSKEKTEVFGVEEFKSLIKPKPKKEETGGVRIVKGKSRKRGRSTGGSPASGNTGRETSKKHRM